MAGHFAGSSMEQKIPVSVEECREIESINPQTQFHREGIKYKWTGQRPYQAHNVWGRIKLTNIPRSPLPLFDPKNAKKWDVGVGLHCRLLGLRGSNDTLLGLELDL